MFQAGSCSRNVLSRLFFVVLKLATKGKIAQLSLPDVYTSKRTSSFDPDCFSKEDEKDLLLFLLKIVHCTSVQASDSGMIYKSKNAAELRRPFLLKFLCFAHYWATWMLKNLALT